MFTGNVLKKFVRARRRGQERPVGVVISFLNRRGELQVGWSLCKKGDTFSKTVGTVLAYARACPVNELAKNSLNGKVPYTVQPELAKMIDRAERYYQL